MEYSIGQPVTIFIEGITDENGQLSDAAALTLTVEKPDGTQTAHPIGDLTHVALGSYKLVVVPAVGEAGEWQWRWEGTNPTVVDEGSFVVRRSRLLGGPAPRPLTGGVCSPWAESGEVTNGPAADYGFDQALLADGLQIASDILYELTGRRYPGECEDTVRPCGYGTRLRDLRPDPVSGYLAGGWCGCNDSRRCGCPRLSELRLPGNPVRSIVNVKLDGDVLPAERYRLDDHRWLVYLPDGDSDPRRGWPCCQRIDLADTEPDTWSVTYTYGMSPPAGGVKAAARLGAQLALAWSPEHSGVCQLPQRVTSISRQGVSMALIDPLTLIAEGRTGLTDVDLWVQSILTGRKRTPASVHVPGASQGMRRTGV